ncbi:MAG TPA: alpha/beta fold hydrolase [Methylomirabilota bacterium]|nr:alpha/beta fold hydrolase [Methylomirabilota bacterium]
MPTTSIGDAELFYEETGDGPPLMLVPGLGGQGSFWISQVPVFSRDFRTVVHDHRGTGRSTHSRLTYSIEQMADDALRLMDALKIDSAHFVGHSTGGAIGQAIALDHPERLRSLVLSATWAGPDPYFRRLFESRRQTLIDSGIEAYLRASSLMQTTPWWVSRNDDFLTDLHRVTAASAAPVEILVSRIDAILRHDRRRRLLEIRVPTLVIVAQDDMITPRFYSDELASRIPGAKLVVLETGGHYAPAINSEPYNAAVGSFLRSQ